MKTIGDVTRADVREAFQNFREAQERFDFLKQTGFETGPLFDQAARIIQVERDNYESAQRRLAQLLGMVD